MTAHVNSRSGDRVPAGVSGEVGRGTVGTDAPTTPMDSVELAIAMFSPALYVVAAGYAMLGIALVWLAVSLAPWGLLILIAAFGIFGAAAICAAVAFGISRLEADPA